MKRKALHKDFFVEIRKTLNRFFSIFLIVALGVAIFAGLHSCKKDMQLTADLFYDKTNLMDLRIIGTLGLTDQDVTAISQIEGVKEAEAAYSRDLIVNMGNSDIVVRTYSLTEKINLYSVKEGRLPENNKECAVDTLFLKNTGLKIGDTITLSSGTEEAIETLYHNTELTIVGSVTDARYLSFSRGSSSIGNGKVNSYLVLPKENYKSSAYSEIYCTIEDAKEINTYSKEYEEITAFVKSRIDTMKEKQNQLRFDEITAEPKKDIIKAEKKLEDGKKELEKSEAELLEQKKTAEEQFLTMELELQTAKNQWQEKKTALEEQKRYSGTDVSAALASQETELAAQKNTLDESEKQVQAKKSEVFEPIEKGERKIQEGKKELEENEAKLEQAKKDLDTIKVPEWFVLDRNSIETYVSFESDAERIDAVSQVFPAIFFLVAALVSLTTMTRMVDEQRTQIGTLKALGYKTGSIASKYILYALFASLGGSIFGVLVGGKLFPYLAVNAYKIIYVDLPDVVMPYHWYYSILATVLAVSCTSFAAYFACCKDLVLPPAELMRPSAPQSGKRIFLEKIPFIWKHLNFTRKSTLRNLFRYKKRFFMTVIGIGGCMALLLVGFGLRDSIFVMSEYQYKELWLQDAALSLEADIDENKLKAVKETILSDDRVEALLFQRDVAIDVSNGKENKSVTLIVPESLEDLEQFYHFRNSSTKKAYHLQSDSVIITEKLAKLLNLSAGEELILKEEEPNPVVVNISAVTENYIGHAVFISPELFERLYKKPPQLNEGLILTAAAGPVEDSLSADLLKIEGITSVSFTRMLESRIDDMLGSLNIVVFVLIICAGMLAFVVLYNLSNININERRRELATLKVLGFYDKEVSAYVYRENILLTLFGIVLGIGIGTVLHRFVMTTCEVDLVMFGKVIHGVSYLYSSLLTFFFSFIICFFMYFKLRKINMVESLKSME